MGSVPEQIATQLVINVTGRALTWAGQQLWKLATEGDENAKRVLDKAETKLSDEARRNGPVSLRVFKEFLEQAPFIEDELTADYFGGVLASSRTGIDRDDRGAAFAQMIGRLSSYQLRAHYIAYATWKKLFNDGAFDDVHEDEVEERIAKRMFLPRESWFRAMEYTELEDPDDLTAHVFNGLAREGLIQQYSYIEASKQYRDTLNYRLETSGLLMEPTDLGYELFLWANGLGNIGIHRFFESSVVFPECEVSPLVDAQAAADL